MAKVRAGDPADFRPLHFTSGGVTLHGAAYIAAGSEPKGCLIVIPEVAGYDRLASLLSPVQMAGITAVYFHPRGLWDSAQQYSFEKALADVKQAVVYLRSPDVVEALKIDPSRIAVGGLSGGGGTVGMIAAAENASLPYAFAAAPWNFAAQVTAEMTRGFAALNEWADNRLDLGLVVPSAVKRFDVIARASAFVNKQLLVVGAARDTLCPLEIGHYPIVSALRTAGVAGLREVIFDTDHFFLDKRTELHELIISWLKDSCRF